MTEAPLDDDPSKPHLRQQHSTISSSDVWVIRWLVHVMRSKVIHLGDLRELLEGVGHASLGLLPTEAQLEDQCIERPVTGRGKAGHDTAAAVRRALIDWLREVEQREVTPSVVLRNARWVGELLNLEADAVEVLAFVAEIQQEGALGHVMTHRACRPRELFRACSVALGIPVDRAKRILSRQERLRALGLLESSRYDRSCLGLAVQDDVESALAEESTERSTILSTFVRAYPHAPLRLDEFGHLADRLEPLRAFLAGALATRTVGVNILLHGAPGTGKTSLAAALAADLGAELFEVRIQDDDGSLCSTDTRLTALGISQRCMACTPNTMVIFDEAEDSVDCSAMDRFGHRTSNARKAWLHRTMESNVPPTVWVVNNTTPFDAATLRRFDFALRVEPPPEAERRAMLGRHFADQALPPDLMAALVSDPRTTPAHLVKAARVARLVRAQGGDVARAVRQALDSECQSKGQRALSATVSPPHYDLAFVNASVDLKLLVGALAARPTGAICLSGPPGSGKTAFVRHMAERLSKPLHALRMSDLLDKYVGETEKRLRECFERADLEGALLFIDEADGLLYDRSRAQRSWELTHVNELLVQLETARGLVVCATNLVESFDPASLRRFMLKIDFAPLRPEQREALLMRMAEQDVPLTTTVTARLRGLPALTPGDYACVRQRLALFNEVANVERWIAGLEDEHARKPGIRVRAAGFV